MAWCRTPSRIAYTVSARLACSSYMALSIAMEPNWYSLMWGITPFKTLIHASWAARISSCENVRVWEVELVPQVYSCRYVLPGGGGGT